MKRTVFAMSMFAAAVVATTGCSALPRKEARYASGAAGAELRGATPVHARRARALVSGPALIKHLETDGDGVVTLYLTDDPGIGDHGCASAAVEGASPVAVLGRRSRVTDLPVPEGKRICAAVTDAGSMSVAWHARATGEAPRDPIDLALLGR